MLVSIGGPAVACVPPPNLSMQQWYSLCGREIEYGYSLGGANRPPHDDWMLQMYQLYRGARPTYNPTIERMQGDLANRMANGQAQNMDRMNREQLARNNNYYYQQRAKNWQQNQTMMYIQNEYCALRNAAHTYCLKAPN